jgi:redox-sensitive bicupin YhaK (pirin superfamily)
MIRLRLAHERGHADHGWLKTHHTFSFGTYQDPQHVEFRALRVMNEDIIAAGQGFGTHPHHDMEIVTYVLEGELEHRDSLGHGEVLRAGEFQRMTAGTGITHSEFNPSSDEPVHLYQIWIRPDRRGLTPGYEQKRFAASEQHNQWRLVASPGADQGSLKIHQDAKIYLARLEPNVELEYRLEPCRFAWLQILRGQVALDNDPLSAGDGAAVDSDQLLNLIAKEPSELLLFDLA